MKKLFSIALGLVLSAFIAVSANAQTYSDVTKYTGFFGHRKATITSVSTIVNETVMDTRANHSLIVSASTLVSGSIGYYLKDGTLISTSSVNFFVTPTILNVAGPLNFNAIRVSPSAPGNASVYVNVVQSR